VTVSAQPGARLPDDAAIERAMQQVKADPNVATERTIKTLRWKDSNAKPSPRPAWLDWVAGFFRWLEQSARLVVWAVVAGLLALLAFYIVRTFRTWDDGPGDSEFVAPTHVQDLDIRPESLPADVGAAARRLWDRHEHRAALALLYRGLLSRLAHVHQLPIRDSSTEGDCLVIAASMHTAGRDYAARLIILWQAAVYGHLDADTMTVHALCDGFAPALDAPAAGEA
jgi:transposase